MPIKYAVINEGTASIAEYPFAGEFPKQVQNLQMILATVPPREFRRQTIEDGEEFYHYLSNSDGRIVGCVATRDTRSRIINGFLEAVEVLIRGPAADLRNAKKMLQIKMEYFNDPANDKIAVIQAQLDQAGAVTTENVEKALARQEKVDEMNAKSNTLKDQANNFDEKAQTLKTEMCWKNMKMMVMIGAAITVVIIIIVFIACKPNLQDC